MRNLPGSADWLSDPEELVSFQTNLVVWGKSNFRPFPWRLTYDPYTILMAEIMLHRTQVTQVVPVFQSFVEHYPDLTALIEASSEDLNVSLSSLGLHWRIDLIFLMVRQIEERFNLQIPQKKADLLSLPGVSDYIASAVRCFAWNIPEPLIDTNTIRVIGRIFDLETKDSSRRNSKFQRLIADLLDPKNPREYNYALLDLAHLICLKKQVPHCQDCPVLSYCCFGQTRIKSTRMN